MVENIKQFFYLLDSQAKKAIPFLIISFFLSSMLDVVGIGLIGIFLTLLIDPTYLIHKIPAVQFVLPNFGGNKIIVICGVLIICAIAMKSFAVIAIQKKMVYFAQTFSLRLKMRLMTAYQYAPYIYHLQKNSDYLISRVQTNIDGLVNNMLMASLTLISNTLMTFFILAFLLMIHPISTTILLAMFICVGVGYDLLIKKNLSAMGKIIAESGGGIYKSIRHALHGLTEVRVLGREKYFSEKLQNKHRVNLAANAVINRQQLIPRYLIENMIAIFTIAVSVVGVALGYNAATILSLVAMFAVAGARLLPTVTQVMMSVNQIRVGYPHLSLVYNEFKDVEQLEKNSFQTKLISNKGKKLSFSQIQLKNVCYKYPQATIPSLTNIDMIIAKGQSIGLIGHSGAGKSTLVNVLMGFLEPKAGQLLVDGQEIKQLRSWLNNFAYIPQSIFLLDDTLRHNIAFGIEEEKIDNNRVWDAINRAQLAEVVNNLSEGVDTPIGENGIRLSGGQRQRVSLARAFYNERDIIVMDEATSSLDNETEKEIINTIKRLKGKKTLIVIAHRLSTVKHCDVLYRLEQGSISKVGTFQEVVGSI